MQAKISNRILGHDACNGDVIGAHWTYPESRKLSVQSAIKMTTDTSCKNCKDTWACVMISLAELFPKLAIYLQ